MPLNEMVLLVKLNLKIIVLHEFYLIKFFRFNIGTERYSDHINAFFLTLTSFYPEIIFITYKLKKVFNSFSVRLRMFGNVSFLIILSIT